MLHIVSLGRSRPLANPCASSSFDISRFQLRGVADAGNDFLHAFADAGHATVPRSRNFHTLEAVRCDTESCESSSCLHFGCSRSSVPLECRRQRSRLAGRGAISAAEVIPVKELGCRHDKCLCECGNVQLPFLRFPCSWLVALILRLIFPELQALMSESETD